MSSSAAVSRFRSLLVIHALCALPMAAHAQRQAAPADPLASKDSVIIVESVRIRTAPSPASLSVDEVSPGTALAIEAGSALNGPWIAVRFDLRTAFVPREYVSIRMAPRAPVMASAAPALPAAAPQPTRVAMAVVDTARSTAPAKDAPVPVREAPAAVRETPLPARQAAATVREAPTPVREAPAPVLQAGTPLRAETRPAVSETPAPTRVSPAPAALSPALSPAPARETAPAERTAAAPQTPPQPAAQDPTRMRRPTLPGMVSVALLGSVTSYTVTGATTRVLHVSGHPLLTLSAFGWGVYAAPEFGAGAGHRSTMLGGGIMRDILRSGPVHLSALAGMTTYSEQPDGYYASSFVSRSIRAASGGALVSLPLIGPARLAYRVQYLRSVGDTSTFTQVRHAVGLRF